MFWLKAALPDKGPTGIAAARRQLNALELPEGAAHLACLNHILAQDLGFLKSAETQEPVLGSGEQIPMWSYAAVEYLMGLDLSHMEALELGGGQSTAFLAKRCARIDVIETNPVWIQSIRARGLANVTVHEAKPNRMPDAIAQLGRSFDIISIDPAENRYACAQVACVLLKPGGLIILDNAEWYPNTTALLRAKDLIQIDFHDFRPLHHYRTVTSLFLHPAFRARPRATQLPQIPVGGRPVDLNGWDQVTG